MAILNFPNNPQIDDQYTGNNGTTYTFDGVKWVGREAGGAAGTNSLQNSGFTVQVDIEGDLVLPVGSIIKDSNGDPIVLEGAQGPAGPQGEPGTNGVQGPVGPAGPQGIQGPAGAAGAQGPQGIQGVPGNDGAQGPAGNDGAQGPAGNDGAQGPAGNDGAQGPAGADGAQGPAGADGAQGSPGVGVRILGEVTNVASLVSTPTPNVGDSYIVTENGNLYAWTGSSYLDVGQIVGPQGPAGNNGAPGADGAQGPQGDPGLDGNDGADGTSFTFAGQWDFSHPGYNVGDVVRADDNNLYIAVQFVPQSSVGLNNTGYWQSFLQSGADGAQGPAGADGAQGPAGNDGAPGADGAQGPAGEQGPIGIEYRGAYNNGEGYANNDVVTYQGSTYIMVDQTLSAGYDPISYPNMWNVLAAKGDQGEPGSGGGTAFDQDLNTTNNVAFSTVTIGNSLVIDGTITIASSATDVVADTFAIANYRTAKYLIQATSESDVQSVEVILIHNDTDAFITTYTPVYTNETITVGADVSGETARLLITTLADNVIVDFTRTSLLTRTLASPGAFTIEGDLMSQFGTEDLSTSTGLVDLNV